MKQSQWQYVGARVLIMALTLAGCSGAAKPGAVQSGATQEGTAQPGERVKLKNGSEFTVSDISKEGALIWLQVLRADIESVNGNPLPPPVMAGEKAPAFSAKDLQGNAVTVPVPGSPMLVQFWASWCPYCRKDFPLMQRLEKDYGPLGLKIVTVSIDQDVGKLHEFLKEQPSLCPVVAAFGPGATEPSPKDLYEAKGVPHYFLIDAKGVIKHAASGSVTTKPESEREFLQGVRELMTQAGLSLPPEETAKPAAAGTERPSGG